MPSIDHLAGRHVVIDKRKGQYVCFPDVLCSTTRRLIAVYREADTHVAGRCAILYKISGDLGRTWSKARYLNEHAGHCPRISTLGDGSVAIIDDMTNTVFYGDASLDSFTPRPYAGAHIPLADRLLELPGGALFTTGHTHRGTFPHPKTRQPTSEQMGYVSENRGQDFHPLSVVAYDRNLVLCEASVVRLPSGELYALMRENSFVYEPMYSCRSFDDGRTWSRPAPTRLIGHRPTVGLTREGKLLVTYRNVGPDPGTAAWLGDASDLDGDFAVHGRTPSPDNPRLTSEGLLIENASGKFAPARYALRPLTDPERARATLACEVRVDRAGKNGCGVLLGGWWRLFPDRIEPPDTGGARAPSIALRRGRFHELRFVYDKGRATLYVDNEKKIRIEVDANSANARPIVFGTQSFTEHNHGRHIWRTVALAIDEPEYARKYRFHWDWRDGLPDAYARARVLELKNARFCTSGDFGYSGWTQLPDGRFFCAYHHNE
ncbi:MAG: exo-alpha-sialidase, partial [Desulfovibrionaceae bacterium]|nr:exo-alpha-sialidase [Desulfovibrionaceae bacterium]